MTTSPQAGSFSAGPGELDVKESTTFFQQHRSVCTLEAVPSLLGLGGLAAGPR